MKIAILTSSRADYGIYRPLLKELQSDPSFELEIVAFGTHLSPHHGYTVTEIERDGFEVHTRIESLVSGDTELAISSTMALTSLKFADYWDQAVKRHVNLAFCLGDRFEMFAAVSASTPYNFPLAHIHGGETTLGAIDNTYRHSISHMANIHFTATEAYARRVAELVDDTRNIYYVGALSLDNLSQIQHLSKEEFEERFGISFEKPTILLTIHPETKNPSDARLQVQTAIEAIQQLDRYQALVTMPNADTAGSRIREALTAAAQKSPGTFKIVENLGTQGYFSAMSHCAFLLGNTSSGIIEAASLQRYVINLGDRQKGRARGSNVIDSPYKPEAILQAIHQIEKAPKLDGANIYRSGNAAKQIVSVLKKLQTQTWN